MHLIVAGAVQRGPAGLRGGVPGWQGALWVWGRGGVWGWGGPRQSGGPDGRPWAAACRARLCRAETGIEVLDALWLCLGRCVCVCVCGFVLGGLRICLVHWGRGEFCVCCVRGCLGVYFICLLLSWCCPPRHHYPCNTQAAAQVHACQRLPTSGSTSADYLRQLQAVLKDNMPTSRRTHTGTGACVGLGCWVCP